MSFWSTNVMFVNTVFASKFTNKILFHKHTSKSIHKCGSPLTNENLIIDLKIWFDFIWKQHCAEDLQTCAAHRHLFLQTFCFTKILFCKHFVLQTFCITVQTFRFTNTCGTTLVCFTKILFYEHVCETNYVCKMTVYCIHVGFL